MFACTRFVKEDAGAFECDIDIQCAPRQVRRIAFRADLDRLAVDDKVVAFGFDVICQNAMNGIVFQKMCVGGDVTQVVDGHDFNIGTAAFNDGTQNQTANTTKTINRYANSHSSLQNYDDWYLGSINHGLGFNPIEKRPDRHITDPAP